MKEIISRFLPMTFNDLLALMYFPFVIIWVIMLAIIFKYIGVTVIEALGLGTATGVILSKFSDIYQFYFRKAKTEPASSTSTTTSTTTTPPDGDKK
jgi:hypothetical protein